MTEETGGVPDILLDEDYNRHMALFLRTPNAHSQDRATNDRASMIALVAIARYPQASAGGDLIIADSLMDAFDPKPSSATGIGIREMAQVVPDGSFCAGIVNDIHRKFNIPRVVTTAEAGGQVCTFGVHALEDIRTTTISAARNLGIAVPDEVVATSISIPGETLDEKAIGPWTINRPIAFALHDILDLNPPPTHRSC